MTTAQRTATTLSETGKVSPRPFPPVGASHPALLCLRSFFLLLLLLVIPCALSADVAAPPSSPSTAAATGASLPHFFAALAAFVGTVRLFAKFIQSPLQNFLTAAIARVNDSPEKDDDQLLHNWFAAPWYRLLAFTLDYLLSLKLPTSDSLLTHREENPK